MTTTIKITALTDIGANLAGTTLVPVVNMAGTPTTQRANVNNIANYVLNKATGANLGPVANVKITGGTAGQVLTTNGSNVLVWASGGNGTTGGSNTQVQFNDTGFFGGNSGFTFNKTTGILAVPFTDVSGVANIVGSGATVAAKSVLNVASTFGSNSSAEPASAQAIRGRVTGANLTKTRNYVTGVTGQYLVTGTNASEFIKAGILGVVGDQTTTADGAVVAYLDGDGGLTTANAAYAVSMKNSTPNSGFNYGLDLQFISLNLGGVTTSTFKQADIRFNNGVKLVANTANNISINANVTVGNIIATNLGNIVTINLDGNSSNVLRGDGTFAADANSSYGNSNVVSLMTAFGSNTITTTGNVSVGNIIGNGQALTGIAGANVSGFVPNANVANTAFAVAGANVSGFVPNANVANTAFAVAAANVSGLGNIATINLTGSNTNVLYGNGVFAAVAGGANTGNITFDQSAIESNQSNAYINLNASGSGILSLGTNDQANVRIVTDEGNVNNQWTFGTDGNLTLPGNLVIAGNANVFGTNSSLLQTTGNRPLIALSSGANGAVSSLWVEDIGNVGTSNIAAVYANPTVGSGIVRIAVGQNGGNAGPNLWDFGTDGNLTIPGTSGGFIKTVSNASIGIAAVDNGTNNPAQLLSINAGSGAATSIVSAYATNATIQTNAAGNINTWSFNNAGNLTLPTGGQIIVSGGLVSSGASPAPTINGFSITNSVGISGNGNIAGNNISATGNISGNTNGFAIGYLNIPQVAAANATLALTDAGKHYYSTTAGNFTLTVPLNSSVAFATGTAVSIVVQAAGNILVNAASGVTLYMAGNSTAANRVVGGYGMATLMKVGTDTWFINGTGVA